MKLSSFSIPSKPSSSRITTNPSSAFSSISDDDDDNDNHQNPQTKKTQFITEFDKSAPDAKVLTIKPQEDTWRQEKKMKNINIISNGNTGDNLQFEDETDASIKENPKSDMGYGLNLRSRGVEGRIENGDLMKPKVDEVLIKKYKDDMLELPQHRGMDEYKEVALEGFAEALLSSYGWSKGKGIGRNGKADAPIYEIRQVMGGFASLSDSANVDALKEGRKPGNETNDGKNDVKGMSSEGNSRIDNGDQGLRHSRDGSKSIYEEGSSSRTEKSIDGKRKRNEEKRERTENKLVINGDGEKGVCWLTPHIRVRVVSKGYKGGRLYLEKGKILDVIGPRTCVISMDGSKEIVENVSQDVLETALPKRGGLVKVLYGRHKGVYARLMERNSKEEKGVIQDMDTHEVITVGLDQIAEYLGEP